MTAGRLMRVIVRDPRDDRAAVTDDVKPIAEAICESMPYVLAEDKRTLAKYTQRLATSQGYPLRALLLVDGFDLAWLNGGQSQLPGTRWPEAGCDIAIVR